MDRGEFIKQGYKVIPALDGSWLITSNVDVGGYFRTPDQMRAFSNYKEMLDWLHEEHRISGSQEGPQPDA